VTVVLDTNVLLVTIPKTSRYRLVFDAFLAGKFSLALSSEVLNEYTEIIEQRTNHSIASNLAELITSKKNVSRTEVHFRWNLISIDPDDNKFIDLYVASNADYLVTNDTHFSEAAKSPFPRINIMNLDDFLDLVR
jgi:uncharacterized protein